VPPDEAVPADIVATADGTAPAAVTQAIPSKQPSLLRNLDFQALWTSEALAAIAKESAEIAYPLLILATTGSVFYAGIVGSVQLLTASVLSIPGGTLADRIDRRLLLMACNLLRVLLLGLFALLIFTHHTNIFVILSIAVCSAACLGISQPTGLAAIKQLVPPEQLTQATAQNQIRFFGATMVGPPIGGSLFGVARAFPFFGAAISFLLSSVLLLFVRKPMKVEPTGTHTERRTIEGFRFLFREPVLRNLILWLMGSNMAFTHSGVFLALIATAKQRGAPDSLIGFTLAIAAVGGLVGSLLCGWVLKKVRPSVIVLYAAWIGPVAAIGLAVIPGAIGLGCVVAFVFVRGPIVSSLFLAYLAKVAPNEVQGRALGAVMFMSMVATPIGVFLVGSVFDLGGPIWVFAMIGTIATIAALPTLSRHIRHLTLPEGSIA
jgi:predicted MFS family arabinose efflux permease